MRTTDLKISHCRSTIYTHIGLGNLLDRIQTQTSRKIQSQTVADLISRLLPERAEEFDVKVEGGHAAEENGYFQVGVQDFWTRENEKQYVISHTDYQNDRECHGFHSRIDRCNGSLGISLLFNSILSQPSFLGCRSVELTCCST